MSTRARSIRRLNRDESGRFITDKTGRLANARRLLGVDTPKRPRDLGDMPMTLEKRVRVADVDRAIAAHVHDRFLWLTLADQRRLGVPLGKFPDLAEIDPAKLQHAEIEDEGQTVYLPDVPEWIYVPALLGYPPD